MIGKPLEATNLFKLTRALTFALILASGIGATHSGEISGRWEGNLAAPGAPIAVTVDLVATGEATPVGAIHIPAQGIEGFPLGSIRIDGPSVSFAMSGIPGEPVFHGALSDDGAVLSGELRQSGSVVPFRLERTGEARLEAPRTEPALSPELVSALAGRWEGAIEMPGQSLRVAFVLTAEGGKLTATFDSPDQGRTGLPVTRIAVDGTTLQAELAYAGVVYHGTFDEPPTAIAGEWRQGGGSVPLTLERKPAADPAATGPVDATTISPRALELLADRVQALVDEEEIVGGELLVVHRGRHVLRRAFGWMDREARRPLEVGAIYCVRSMTKPVVGTAIQMLIDEGKLRLDTAVREILPFFDGPQTRKIRVEHLLTHTAGFPFTTIGKPLADYADLTAVAAEAAGTKLLFEPGARFEYSDAGSDILGAIVAKLAGSSVEEFVGQRILAPLGMAETLTLLGDDRDVLDRIPSAYSGGTAAWAKHWDPSDPPIFPIFLTSQSLYATTTDYARFLALWAAGGKVGDRRLLSAEAVERALRPNRRIPYPGGFDGLESFYGQQWQLFAPTGEDGPSRATIFGHSGSDGTHAWVWPERELMVLFFTQSRGTLAGVALERTIQTLLIDGDLDDPSLVTPSVDAEELERIAGLYWDEDRPDEYLVVAPQGNGLTVERPGRMLLRFRPDVAPGRFVHDVRPSVWIEFDRDDARRATAIRTFSGRTHPRHAPADGLPTVEEVVASVRAAHRLDRLPAAGVVRMTGSMKIPARNLEGPVVTLFDDERIRNEVRLGGGVQIVGVDRDRAWSHADATGTEELTAALREQTVLGGTAVTFGDWRRHFERVEVLKRSVLGDRGVLQVRVVPSVAKGMTIYVDEATGRVVRTDSLVQIPGIGLVGLRNDFDDFREVGGMSLPFRTVSRFATELIGQAVTTVNEAEVGVRVDAGTFAPPEASRD